MTRVIYEYPDDAVNGDAFVVEDVDISPSTVTIRMKRYTPSWQARERADQMERVLAAADAMIEEMDNMALPAGRMFLLQQSYRRMRLAVRP